MVWIELTVGQVKLLAEEEALVRKALKDGRPGSILGQIYPNENTIRACFVPKEVAEEINEILWAMRYIGDNNLRYNTAKTVKYLRKQIPSFECKKGCTDCCGPVPFSRCEWDQVEDKKIATSLTCPYATENGCEIYEQRPILCRLFGVVEKMRCPHGCGPTKMLSRKKENEIMRKYRQIVENN